MTKMSEEMERTLINALDGDRPARPGPLATCRALMKRGLLQFSGGVFHITPDGRAAAIDLELGRRAKDRRPV